MSAGLFGSGDELGRRDDAPLRVAPAHQRLGGDDTSVFETDNWLILQVQLFSVDRLA